MKEHQNTIDTKRVVKYLLHESFKSKKLYISLAAIPISTLFIGTAIPFTVSKILAGLAQQGADYEWGPVLVILVACALAGVVANRIGFLVLLSSQAHTVERVQNDLLHNLLKKGRDFYANRMTGKIVSDASGLGSAIIQFQDVIAINIIAFLVTMVAGIILVLINSVILGLGLAIMTASVIAGAWFTSRRRAPLREARHEAQRQQRGYFADLILNNQAVKIFARESFEESNHEQLNKELKEHRLRDWRLLSMDGNNRIIAILILQVLFIALTAVQVSNDPSLLAAGIFAFAFTITLSNRLFEISTMIRGLENSITEASSMVEVMDAAPKITDADDAKELVVTKGEVNFENVTFQYDDAGSDDALFANLSLRIKPGEKVGLVGHSGSGKTTVTNLLLRFIDIDSGSITIDGQDIKNITQQSLRKNIAYVPQEPLLFHRTLKENIQYGNLAAPQQQLEQTAKMAHAHEFIKDLPQGYETLVGERGVKLSGGQRQRVAIARAMLKNAPILVLDEATSALDSESESLIQDALWKLMENKTAIVIAHRLSTIQKMDRIIVLDRGTIVEQGSHKELLKKKGTYANLWAHQSGGFIEE